MLLLVVTFQLVARIEMRAALLAVEAVVVRHSSSPHVVAATAHVGLMWRMAADRRCAARRVPDRASDNGLISARRTQRKHRSLTDDTLDNEIARRRRRDAELHERVENALQLR